MAGISFGMRAMRSDTATQSEDEPRCNSQKRQRAQNAYAREEGGAWSARASGNTDHLPAHVVVQHAQTTHNKITMFNASPTTPVADQIFVHLSFSLCLSLSLSHTLSHTLSLFEAQPLARGPQSLDPQYCHACIHSRTRTLAPCSQLGPFVTAHTHHGRY